MQISVVRGNIGKHTAQGAPLPTVRVEQEGQAERHCHEVYIKGPCKVGPYQGGRTVIQTDSEVEEVLWGDPTGA